MLRNLGEPTVATAVPPHCTRPTRSIHKRRKTEVGSCKPTQTQSLERTGGSAYQPRGLSLTYVVTCFVSRYELSPASPRGTWIRG